MTIVHFPASRYVAMPWKNGLGLTEEICLLPEGSTREVFGLRVSRATIAEPGRFSAFPGVERAITLIEGEALDLRFDDHAVALRPLDPVRFDSALTPVGDPKGESVRVLNVMAARADWRLGPPHVLADATAFAPEPGGLAVAYAAQGPWTIRDATATFTLNPGDTALLDTGARLVPEPGEGAPTCALLVPMAPALAASAYPKQRF